MGIVREFGYSASVEGFLVLKGERLRLAKTNGCTFVLADSRDLPPGTTGELVVIVDGRPDTKSVRLPDGATKETPIVRYEVEAPF